MFRAVLNKYELNDEGLNWSNLPVHERERRWISEFRMVEEDFSYLFNMVKAEIPKLRTSIQSMRQYKRKEKLLVTLNLCMQLLGTLRDTA
jgi:hypothetical protein